MSTDMGVFYACTAILLIEAGNIEQISAVYGAHETGKVNGDVTQLEILSQNMEFFPTNLYEFFPNIASIEFGNNSISSVRNDHLNSLPNLWYLGLAHNRISSLDSNLFSGLSSLQYVILAVNQITSIDSNLFASLKSDSMINLSNNTIRHVGHELILPKNSALLLRNNICVDALFVTGTDNIEQIRFDLLIKCPPSISLIESTLEIRPNFLRDLINRVRILEEKIETKNGIEINDKEINKNVMIKKM